MGNLIYNGYSYKMPTKHGYSLPVNWKAMKNEFELLVAKTIKDFKIDPKYIINVDEIAVCLCPTQGKVIGFNGET